MKSLNRKLTDRLVFLIEFLNLAEATGDRRAQWERYQIRFLNNQHMLTCDTKSRQVGWSFTAAAEAVAESILVPRSTIIFVSVTQVEASEKIRYSNYVLDSLDEEVRPKKIIDNRTEIELQNGSRIISHPCRPPRGKARARVYLDEIAHYPRDEEIYTAAVPIITRGGVIRMGSSPLGASGKFWEIHTEALQRYPGYARTAIPWWTVDHLCKDVKEAEIEAPKLRTHERVTAYGTQRLKNIYENMPVEDFQQEYECEWTDESVAWITWDEIKRNQVDAGLGLHVCEEITVDEYDIDLAKAAIDNLAHAIEVQDLEREMYAGVDIGRKKNLSEFFVVGEVQGATTTWPLRLMIGMDRLEFENQEDILTYALETLPIRHCLIDNMGLGMQLAENMENRYPETVEGLQFTNQNKEEMAVETKLRFQRGLCPIPLNRDLSYQIHSIKRMVTASKRMVFDTEANTKHHADKFWALALAHQASRYTLSLIGTTDNPLAGYRG